MSGEGHPGVCVTRQPPHRGDHSWNRDVPVCPQTDPCLLPEAAGSLLFSGWQAQGLTLFSLPIWEMGPRAPTGRVG